MTGESKESFRKIDRISISVEINFKLFVMSEICNLKPLSNEYERKIVFCEFDSIVANSHICRPCRVEVKILSTTRKITEFEEFLLQL